ncbi:5-oxoprolinase subunit PxpB [Chromobacterium violaceum]|uniref:5-oxoprolinase subunit PxpB n=1 Tax=Chromobacterium violaceum TaxID=536 RepID=UPI0009D9F14D|nr:5-oxoprolinase subunit PxpB [Chromobacterium violaceum]MBX9268950.1 5-oxoprolinase subunit PxpB [Chromobacterium violaceum]OQS47774.1 allophanate hydrolase [Chromobacterium violaceum]OQS49904.1 allophanate hydrolase [Chromobacterium violaceum]QRO33253.1 5-oxoprolinase subunit PxpB [Chromobacterium violaceum]QRQ16945.1 5-oxoprolinase subunit PxpB [Chromobacterium violaceum]
MSSESHIPPAVHWLGNQALVLELPPPATLDCQRRIWRLAERLRADADFREVIPGMNNLTLELRPGANAAALPSRLRKLWQLTEGIVEDGRVVDIPVSYGGRHGPDLEAVARHCGLTPDEVVSRHAAGRYTVFFLGFQPGFAYLGGLDPALSAPRRATPRQKVPAGSVAIGGSQTGIYPTASPGGWQIIGRSDAALFDPSRQPPCPLRPGDIVRFVPMEDA